MTNIGDKLSSTEVDMLITNVDKDGDGQLDFEEFVSLMTSFKWKAILWNTYLLTKKIPYSNMLYYFRKYKIVILKKWVLNKNFYSILWEMYA